MSSWTMAFRSMPLGTMALKAIARHTRPGLKPILAEWGHREFCGLLVSQAPRMRKNCLKQGEIHVCQRQRPSRQQAEGSRRAWRTFPCTGNPERIQIQQGHGDLRRG